jgi:hypothetical protein
MWSKALIPIVRFNGIEVDLGAAAWQHIEGDDRCDGERVGTTQPVITCIEAREQRWQGNDYIGNQPCRKRSVLGCEMLQELRMPFVSAPGRQPSKIARHCSQLVRRSLCVIGCGPLQGLAILTGQLST